MSGKVIIRFFAFFGALTVAALGVAYVFRDGLVMVLAPRVLGDRQMALTRFEGLQFDAHNLSINDIDVTLASGQQLVLRNLAVSYHFDFLLSAPQLQTVELASAQLLPTDESSTEATEVSGEQENLLLSDLLKTLREFPLTHAAIAALRIPQSSKPLALQLDGRSGALDIRIDDGELHVEAHFSQADATATASLQAALARNNDTLGNFALTLQPLASTYALNGNGRLTITDLDALLDALEQAPLPFKSANLEWDIAGSVANDIRGTFASAVNGPADGSAPSFVIGMQTGSTLVLPAGVVDGLGELSVAFSDRMELNVITGSQPVVTGALPLQVRGDWQQEALSVDARVMVSECGLSPGAACSITFDGNAGLGTYSLSGVMKADIVGKSDIDDPLSHYHISTEALTLGGLPALTPAFDIDVGLTLDQQQLSFQTPLLLRDAPDDTGIAIAGNYNLDTGAVVVQVNVPPLEFAEGRPLSNWFNEWPYAFDLLDGSLTADLDLQWQPDAVAGGKLTGNVSTLLQDLAGSYEDIFFRGLNGELSGTVDSAAELPLDTPPLSLTVAGVDVGLPLDNLTMNFRVERDTQRLLVDSLSVQVLGGMIGGTNLDYGFNRESNELTLRFDGLRIERMLELADYDDVAASGAVSGEIPLTITADGISVAAGTLQADAPGGSIRYAAGAAVATGNPGLDLVNQALGNYQFDSLLSDINYTPEGELVLAMKMQGHNPDMNNGQRINLNLNLSDNIPALLQSLQAARAIEDFLQQQYSNPPQ